MLRTRLARAALLVLLTPLLPLPAAGQFLDCRTARLPSELEICRHGFLNGLDQQLLSTYHRLRDMLPPQQQKSLDESQQRWTQDRDRCGANHACLRALYARRMDELVNWH